MKQRSDGSSIEKPATETPEKKMDLKRETKNKYNGPPGHNFEATAHFKQFSDSSDPYYIYKLNDRRGNPDKLKASFAFNMNETKDYILSKEFCFFDGKVKRFKGFVSLTASVSSHFTKAGNTHNNGM